MKECKKMLLFLGLVLLLIPTFVFAESYKALNLEETLTSEKIEHDLKNYKETDDQITIYMFRGERCGHCQNFLKFLNENIEEYGKYFKLVSYEVWHVEDNAALMQKVANQFDLDVKGVPFIVIGETSYQGFNENKKEEILETIKNYYENKNTYKDVVATLLKEKTNKTNDTTDAAITIVAVLATISIIGFLIYTAKEDLPSSNTEELESKEEKNITSETLKETKTEQKETPKVKTNSKSKETKENTKSNETKKAKEVSLPKLKEETKKETKKKAEIDLPKKKETTADSNSVKTTAKAKKTTTSVKAEKKEATTKKTNNTTKKASEKTNTTTKKSTKTNPKQTTKK